MKTSQTISTISKALIEFQGRMVKVTKDAVNPHFKNRYASLSQIVESVQKPLNKCGLAVIQLPEGDHGLETVLIHTSGEYIADHVLVEAEKYGRGFTFRGSQFQVTIRRTFDYSADAVWSAMDRAKKQREEMLKHLSAPVADP
ncbi:MAG TPA: ERF family protein [Bacteroidales bacterium]|nr:ERF family protein [Bacteroidales bacterium]